jgi:hypothetical protein
LREGGCAANPGEAVRNIERLSADLAVYLTSEEFAELVDVHVGCIQESQG